MQIAIIFISQTFDQLYYFYFVYLLKGIFTHSVTSSIRFYWIKSTSYFYFSSAPLHSHSTTSNWVCRLLYHSHIIFAPTRSCWLQQGHVDIISFFCSCSKSGHVYKMCFDVWFSVAREHLDEFCNYNF